MFNSYSVERILSIVFISIFVLGCQYIQRLIKRFEEDKGFFSTFNCNLLGVHLKFMLNIH